MVIVCRFCGHLFKRAHIVNPRGLKPWPCTIKACRASGGYGTIASIAEAFTMNAKRIRSLAGLVWVRELQPVIDKQSARASEPHRIIPDTKENRERAREYWTKRNAATKPLDREVRT